MEQTFLRNGIEHLHHNAVRVAEEEPHPSLACRPLQLRDHRPAELLLDYPRPFTQTKHSAVRELSIHAHIHERVARFSAECSSTVISVLLTAIRITHYRFTGVADAIIGLINLSPSRGVTEKLQCIPIAIGDDSFKDVVRQVQKVVAAPLANQDTRCPGMQMAVYFNSVASTARKTQSYPESPREFDLELHIDQKTNSFDVRAVFSPKLYCEASIDAFLSAFGRVLENGFVQWTAPVASLNLLGDQEYKNLERLELLRIHKSEYARDASLVDVFRKQVLASPTTVAVKDHTLQLTYSELDEESDLLAQWLLSRELAAESLVGVIAPRSCQTVVAILGILKAHLAYVPLDPKTPSKRLENTLQSIPGLKLVLLGSAVPDVENGLQDVTAVRIVDAINQSRQTLSSQEPRPYPTPAATSLAYVMFTSGSTGEPKGVMIEHRNILRLATHGNMASLLPRNPRMAHIASVAFDMSTWEIYAMLLNGGTLICIDFLDVVDSLALAETIAREQINTLLITPALLKQYLIDCPESLGKLDTLYIGGDRADAVDVRSCRALIKGHIVNAYGPTENMGASSIYRCLESDTYENGVPIGVAVSNSGAYVMDTQQQLVPLGVIGELVVTGDGLARGYLKKENNSGRFISVTIAGQQTRAYRTGDYARWRPSDGQLECFGRIDNQVKIRGQRVELGEIEHVLRAHPAVNDAAAVTQTAPNGEVVVAGFVTMGENESSAEQTSANEELQQVASWEERFDGETYTPIDSLSSGKIGRDFIGWTSMYDESAIDIDEMNEWLDDTIDTIHTSSRVENVLEIGTGSGMILFNLADELQTYVGLEPSERAVKFVASAAKSMPNLKNKVKTFKGTALDLGRIQFWQAPDLVVVNSVVQCFPSQSYLLGVMKDLLGFEGIRTLFFGDIRSYALHRDFLARRSLYMLGDGDVGRESVQSMIRDMEDAESELLVDPGFFTALQARMPHRVHHVEILPKKMHATNELSAYRYAAVIHLVDDQVDSFQPIHEVGEDAWIDFRVRNLNYQSLLQLLRDRTGSDSVAISNIPYSKTILERHIIESLDSESDNSKSWLSSVREKAMQCPSLSPMDLTQIAREAGYRVELSWARQHSQRGGLDAIFHTYDALDASSRVLFRFPTDHQGRSSQSLSSHPLQQHQRTKVQGELSAKLEAELPSYMVPQSLTILREMPVNQNGKVDRQALSQRRAARKPGYMAVQQPVSASQRQMQAVWAKVLGIETVTFGLEESFFQIGGNSIDAMKVVAEARRVGLELTVADIFRHPTLRDVSSHVSSARVKGDSHIPRYDKSQEVEQSFAQERLWFLDQLHPELTWFVIPFVMKLGGNLSLDALWASVLAVEERHESLRTVFATRGDSNIQVVNPFEPKQLEVIDVPSGTDDELYEMVKNEQLGPFKLQLEPGWRVTVYRLGQDTHALCIVMHHIVSDGWSGDVLRRELSAFYTAALHNQSLQSAVEPLPITYRDYSIWQRQPEQLNAHQQQLDYWYNQLETSRPAEFLCDYPRPATLSGLADVCTIAIEGSLYNKLQAFCRKQKVTPFMVLLAAFRATHYRLTGVTDAAIGGANANRDRWELKDMIGFFVNLQCLRIKIEDESFEQLVDQVQATTTASFGNQEVPFEKVVAKLRKERDMARHPLVQIAFALHSQLDLGRFEFEGVESETLKLPTVSRFDMECHFYQEQGFFRGELIYSTDLFHSDTIENLVSVFLEVLTQGLTSPTVPIASLPLLREADYDTLETMGLLDIKTTQYPRDSNIGAVFAAQARLCPQKMAVKDSSTELSYLELDNQSDILAQWLRHKVPIAETLIGVVATRSCETIVTMLAILKANLAYLPLDSRTPVERIKTVLTSAEDLGLVLVGSHTPRLSFGTDKFETLLIEDAINMANLEYHTAPTWQPGLGLPSATSLAYVMFTSGSSGTPKGVMVEHRSILRLATNNNKTEHLPVAPVTAHVASIAFDMSTWEIYSTLLNGGSLICVDYMDVLNAPALARLVSENSIQSLFVTPTILKQYLLECPDTLKLLSVLYVGGDKADAADMRLAKSLVKGAVVNAYGPTENGGCSAVYVLCDEEQFSNGVPIGEAFSNSGALVMDVHQHLVPVGVIGELVVTGDGLARGYLDSRQDRDRFVSIDVKGQHIRAYRTGDYVRWRPTDTKLEYFGRMDGQVKVRGQRVELGEIEHALRRLRSVGDAAVALVNGRDGSDAEASIMSFITLKDSLATAFDEQQDEAESKHVDSWEDRFNDDTYLSMQSTLPCDIGRDFTGWTSMYDGTTIDKNEMNEWLDETIETMANGSPVEHVLEIGTGSGMILFNLRSDDLKSYVGLELSGNAVDFVQDSLQSRPSLQDKVTLFQAAATHLAQLRLPAAPSLVVLNSVVQYFPSQEYLSSVIHSILELESVKTIFLGDIRSFALSKQFFAARALRILGANATKHDYRRVMTDLEQAESELLVDAAFFTALKDHLPHRVRHVEILPKKMHATNELSAFRYAAVIHVASAESPSVHHLEGVKWIDYEAEKLDRESLLRLVQDRSADHGIVALQNIPYSKTIIERHMVEALYSPSMVGSESHNWVSSARQAAQARSSLSATDVLAIAQEAGLQAEISWARQHSQDAGLDVIFHRADGKSANQRALFAFPTDHQERKSQRFSNQPLARHLKMKLERDILQRLEVQLPSYMVPRRVIVTDRIPLNQNGKVDRRRLVEVAEGQMQAQTAKEQPSTKNEVVLQEIWAKVLGVDKAFIGLRDSFFQLGGSSITAMKVAAAARASKMHLSVADIFRRPQLQELAREAVPQNGTSSSGSAIPPFSLLQGQDEDDAAVVIQELAEQYQLDEADIQDVYPCTPLQEGLFSLTNKKPGAYIMQGTLDLGSGVDVAKLCSAWEEVFSLMPILRTRLVQHSRHGLLQMVMRDRICWSETEQDIDVYLHEDRARSVRLGQPLTRFTLVNDQHKTRWLVWTIHHSLYDGWSMRLVSDAVYRVYAGHTVTPGPQFQSFLNFVQQQDETRAQEYWQRYLQGCEAVAYPDTPRATKEIEPDQVAHYQFQLASARGEDNITTSTVIRAAWALAISRMTNSNDVVFGATVSGRNAPVEGIDVMVAPTFATVPVRVNTSSDLYTSSYLEQVQQQATDMMEFEQTGLQQIAKMSPDCRRACDFQALIVIQPPETDSSERHHPWTWKPTNDQKWFNTYALMVEVQLSPDTISARASFDANCISPARVHNLLATLDVVAQQLDSAHSATKLQDLAATTNQDLDQIWQWNNQLPPPAEACVHQVIAGHVDAHPSAPAICSWDGNMTYAELDAAASRLASVLINHGVEEEEAVPLSFEKSQWAIVAMLAVLKAGGVFVPVDASQAAERREQILSQLNAKVILTSTTYAATLAHPDRTVIVVDAQTLKHCTEEKLGSSLRTRTTSITSAAYILFTSGSTGEAKGVVVDHQALATSCYAHAAMIGFNAQSRVLQFTSYTFDVSIMEILTTLMHGGCVCVPSNEQRYNAIEEAIDATNANTVSLTPSVARLLDPARVPSLQTVILGGEDATAADFSRWALLPHVFNGYGPTECTIFCALHRADNHDNNNENNSNDNDNDNENNNSHNSSSSSSTNHQSSCIGRAVGSIAWVVNSENHNQLAPIGAIGELVVEGPILARGYLNDHQKTCAAFVNAPTWLVRGHGKHAGRRSRLYKTGDLVRYDDTGNLFFVGRKDTQVKIRGQRLELGEVEHHVAACVEDVAQVVAEAVTIEEQSSIPTLVVFLVKKKRNAGHTPYHPRKLCRLSLPPDVKARLEERLPTYMMPKVYFELGEIPINTSGKTDRRLLREMMKDAAMAGDETQPETAHVDKRSPSSKTEEVLRDIVARVLNIERDTVGVDDSFLDLGGDSILAMKLASLARRSELNISAMDVIKKKTISRLALNLGGNE